MLERVEFRVEAVPKPRKGKAHGSWPVKGGPDGSQWPCGHDLCGACASLCYTSGGGRCEFTVPTGERCYMAKGHNLNVPTGIPLHVVIAPFTVEVKQNSPVAGLTGEGTVSQTPGDEPAPRDTSWVLTCAFYRDGCRESFPVEVDEETDAWWPRAEAAGWNLGDPEGDGTAPIFCPTHNPLRRA